MKRSRFASTSPRRSSAFGGSSPTWLRLGSFAAVFTAVLVWPGSQALASSVDAAHEIAVEGEQLRVTSRWYGHLPKDDWEFAAPLPPGTRVINRGATLTLDPETRGIIGIAFAESPGYPLVLELEIPWSQGDPTIVLPLPPEPGWQRVEVEGNYRLIPDANSGLPLHTSGYYGPGDLHVHERLRIDNHLDHRHPGGAVYLPGSLVSEVGGVPARLESGARRKLGLGIVAGGAFVSGLLVLTVVFRRSGTAVEVEDAEAYLDSEFRNLDDSDASESQ